jgi:aryl-alcohol dehydrogenase-like predicted oxidoreductase
LSSFRLRSVAQVQLSMSLAQLRSLPGAADAERAWAASRAAAQAYACDAQLAPLVTGHVNRAALARLTASRPGPSARLRPRLQPRPEPDHRSFKHSLRSLSVEERILGGTGRAVSVIGLGTWQLGADWGEVEDSDALAVLDAAAAAGVTFLDTADVYGDGRSERLIGQFLADNPGLPIKVATKMGRRVAQDPALYTLDNFRAWTDRSRVNLGVDTLDLVQLHCPPTAVYSSGAVYDALDTLVAEQRIAAYGVSVETCDQALTAIARPGTASVQIILNAFRRKPLDGALPAARAAGVGIIARVPLASGLLSGRYSHDTAFAASDHRTYNRHGEAFDAGETFSGVDFDAGVDAAREFAALAPAEAAPAQAALRWVIQQPGVTTVIPGARNPEQARQNAAAAGLPAFTAEQLASIKDLYDRRIRAQVHDRW